MPAWMHQRGSTSMTWPGVRPLALCAINIPAAIEQAAGVSGMTTAAWVPHMVRQMILADFPAGWSGA